MIKVKNIQHSIGGHMACKGKLILIWGDCREEEFYKYGIESHDKTQFAKPIIISETEKIEKTDVCLDLDTHTIFNFSGDYSTCRAKKILAMPEHLNPSASQGIFIGILKEGDEVLLECEERHEHVVSGGFRSTEDFGGKGLHHHDSSWFEIKLNKDNHVTILAQELKPIELNIPKFAKTTEKTYTESQLIELLTDWGVILGKKKSDSQSYLNTYRELIKEEAEKWLKDLNKNNNKHETRNLR